MRFVFLESSNGLPLTKKFTSTKVQAYPLVKNVNSHEYDVPKSNEGLKEFETLLRQHAAAGHSLLKGILKRPLFDESRAGHADRAANRDLLVLDLDAITLPGYKLRKSLSDRDVTNMAETFINLLPTAFHDVSYIAQASSSLGMKGQRLSFHIFMFMEVPVPVRSLKLWLKTTNHEVEELAHQLELSANGQSIKYALDISVADNSHIIFVAPPEFEDTSRNPFSDPEHRIVLMERGLEAINLVPMISRLNPEAVQQQETAIKSELRNKAGLSKKTAKIRMAAINNQPQEILLNPDRVTITIENTDNYPFIRCNVNGGDSRGYYFTADNPIYMFNFKGEPVWELEKADPDFFMTLPDLFADKEKKNQALRPIILRDFYTDTYYNGLFDPNLNQFSSSFPLTPTSKMSMEGFMRSHGRPEPDYIPDARVVFEPFVTKNLINLTKTPFYVNMYRRTKYMLAPKKPEEPFGYGRAADISNVCPMIHTLMYHMLGNGDLEFEHFVNWLAYIYQEKRKTMTAWILTGVPGTGKGLFVSRVLKPLFGNEHVPMKSLENIEEQFNMYMRSALFLVVDEFRMGDTTKGTSRMADKLKTQITEPTLTIRAMRSNQTELPSFTNFLFLTNRTDAVKIDPGDRRYNVAPRQEVMITEAKPELIANIESIDKELKAFAGVLHTFEVDQRMARTPLMNAAKTTMRDVTMSVFEEFCQALKAGDLKFFADVLDIGLTNTFAAGEVLTAQRFIKAWIADASKKQGYSVIPVEHLRSVYHVQTEQNPRISSRQFNKLLHRNGLSSTRRRPMGSGNNSSALRGVIVEWSADEELIEDLVKQHFNEKDEGLIEHGRDDASRTA